MITEAGREGKNRVREVILAMSGGSEALLSESASAASGKAGRAPDNASVPPCQQRIAATVFIDATYEGDLMAQAGVAYRVGREGRSEYGESLAPEKGDEQNGTQAMHRTTRGRCCAKRALPWLTTDRTAMEQRMSARSSGAGMPLLDCWIQLLPDALQEQARSEAKREGARWTRGEAALALFAHVKAP